MASLQGGLAVEVRLCARGGGGHEGTGLRGVGLAVRAGRFSPLRALSAGMFWARSRWSRM